MIGCPLEGDIPRIVRLGPRQSLDQGRLSRAIVADERGDLTGVNRHVHALEDLDGAEALPDVLQLDDRGFHVSSLATAARARLVVMRTACAHDHRQNLRAIHLLLA